METRKATVSVNEALEKGRREIKYPGIGIIIAFPACIIIVFFILHINLAIGLLIGIVLALIIEPRYTSYAVIKWTLWAFTNTNEIHELRRAAMASGLIPWGYSFDEMKRMSKSEKEAMRTIREQFEQPNLFVDDVAVPQETLFFPRKIMKYLVVIGGIAALILGAVLIISVEIEIGIALLIGGVIAIWGVRLLELDNPALIINEKGIDGGTRGLILWSEIAKEQTYRIRGENSRNYLKLTTSRGFEDIDITYVAVDLQYLNYLLTVYRKRYEHQKTLADKNSTATS